MFYQIFGNLPYNLLQVDINRIPIQPTLQNYALKGFRGISQQLGPVCFCWNLSASHASFSSLFEFNKFEGFIKQFLFLIQYYVSAELEEVTSMIQECFVLIDPYFMGNVSVETWFYCHLLLLGSLALILNDSKSTFGMYAFTMLIWLKP